MSKPKRYDDYYTEEEFVKCTQPGFEHSWICQGCLEEGHVQDNPRVVHDCKMVFLKRNEEGKLESHGQCCCWSEAHGKREDD